MIKLRCHLLWLLLVFGALPLTSYSEVIPFADFSLGLSVQTLDSSYEDDEEDNDDGTVSYVAKAGIGLQLSSFMSVQTSLWGWSSNTDKSRDSSDDDDTSNLTFEGLSVSLEATLQLPFSNEHSDFHSGPYYRFAKQCWSAVLSGLVKPWSGRGCNDLHAVGIIFPSTHRTRAAFYIEVVQTEFDELQSDAVQIGVKVPL